jgi:hypothetical protein
MIQNMPGALQAASFVPGLGALFDQFDLCITI